MKGAKIAGIFAAAGFVLSFVSGLFSGGGAGRVIGMAVLFAAVFGALGAAVQWLSNGVLNVAGASDGGAIGEHNSVNKAHKTGAAVDIVVKDEELPSEENSPRFFVGSNHQMLNASDYGTKTRYTDTSGASASFGGAQAVSGGIEAAGSASEGGTAHSAVSSTVEKTDTVSALSSPSGGSPSASSSAGVSSTGNTAAASFEPIALGTEKVQTVDSSAAGAAISPVRTVGKEDDLEDELDEIPEFQGFATVEDDGSSRNISGDMIEDSDFSQEGAPIRRKGTGAETQDAALMAKAISTVLAKDK